MSNSVALATQPGDLLGVLNEDQLKQLSIHANLFIRSGFCPQKFINPESVMIAAMYGREIGLSFMQSLTDIHVINGVPALSAAGQSAIIRTKCPESKIVIKEQTAMCCTITMWRPGMDKPQEFNWDIEEARQAGLTSKSVWQKHPADMLTARCLTRGYRFLFKDLLGSFGYTPEEAEEINMPAPPAPMAPPPGGIPKVSPEEADKASGIPEEDKPAADPHELDGLDSELETAETLIQADVAYDDWRARNSDKPSTLVAGYEIHTKFLNRLKSKTPSEATQAELIPEEES